MDRESTVVDYRSWSTSGPQGCLGKQLRGWRRTVESCQRRALLLGGNGWGGAPLSASAGDFPHGWQHDTKRWTVLEVSGWLGGDEQCRAAKSQAWAEGDSEHEERVEEDFSTATTREGIRSCPRGTTATGGVWSPSHHRTWCHACVLVTGASC
jgi:hypothetical protein